MNGAGPGHGRARAVATAVLVAAVVQVAACGERCRAQLVVDGH